MLTPFLRAAALALIACPLLVAKGFDPIPKDVWAMKEDPAHGVKGAVVLDQKVVFSSIGIEHLYRVRILSEAGRGAAEIRDLLPEAMNIQGRTSYRDGTSVLFEQRKDLSEKVVHPDGDRAQKVRVALPPGVTADCVMEIKWLDLNPRSVTYAGYHYQVMLPTSLGLGMSGKLGGPFKTLRAEVDFLPDFTWSHTLLCGPQTPMERKDSGAIQRFVFKDIPATELPPFSLPSLAPLPVYEVWLRPWVLSSTTSFASIDTFWNETAKEFYKPHFKDSVKTGAAFARLADEILVDLPEGLQAQAKAIQQRLDRRIRNSHYPTYQERAQEEVKEGWFDNEDEDHVQDLDGWVKKGHASPTGMTLLYFTLLDKAGIHPILALVRDRGFTLFNYDLADPYQAQEVLFGIAEAGKAMLWLDPALRYGQPGLVKPAYQGTPALFLDSQTWKITRGQIGLQAGLQNKSSFAFELEPGAEADQFKAQAGFTAWDEWLERQDYMTMEPSEQAKELKNRFEKGVPQCAVATAEVLDAQNPDKTLTWKVEGTLEHPDTARRTLDPFPGMTAPIPLPDAWPERRTDPILFNRNLTWVAASRIHVPKGTQVPKSNDIVFTNSFGRVVWRAIATPEGEGTLVSVGFRVDIARAQAPATAYPDLKAFVDTVKKAYRQQLVLERP